jgi:hypothetical protein
LPNLQVEKETFVVVYRGNTNPIWTRENIRGTLERLGDLIMWTSPNMHPMGIIFAGNKVIAPISDGRMMEELLRIYGEGRDLL